MCIKIWCYWPLKASTTSEVKNDHAHVIRQGICNKFIEVNFCVGCMVWQPNRLFPHWKICQILMRLSCKWLLAQLSNQNGSFKNDNSLSEKKSSFSDGNEVLWAESRPLDSSRAMSSSMMTEIGIFTTCKAHNKINAPNCKLNLHLFSVPIRYIESYKVLKPS